MPENIRTSFYEDLVAEKTKAPAPTLADDALFQKYANKTPPTGLLKTTAGLAPYTGPFGRAEAIHLIRRTMFGVKPADVNTLLAAGSAGAAVDMLLNAALTTPAPPVNNYNATYADPTGVAAGATWVNAVYGDGTVDYHRRLSFKSWWMQVLVAQSLSIQEKMCFFWHNHFATEAEANGQARYTYKHHDLLRTHALGNFKTLVLEVTKDPAMLRYLNGYLNHKNAPDENYARELQELFTLGKENLPNYTQADVVAAAKVLTGWRINSTTGASYFDPSWHDGSPKQFSSFFNNAVIAYQSGAAGAADTTALIDMIFAKVETARYFCRRLYRFFVYYDIDAAVEANIIQPLAQTLISNSFNVLPVISQLFKSEHFFELNSKGCFIRQPLDLIVGTMRTFGVTVPTALTVENRYKVFNYLRSYGSVLAQDLADPPNVSGYPAFYQIPEFYEVWINSNTLPKRLLFTDMMLGSGFTAGTGTPIKIDVLAFAQTCPQAADPDALINYFVELLLGLGLSTAKKTSLKSILLSNQAQNYYWTQAWSDYTSNPTAANTTIVKTRLTTLLLEITRLAEHQLC